MAKVLMKGNEAIGEAGIRAGGLCYFCYPITPQSEVAEYLSRRMPDVGGSFLQAESEVAVSNMLYGAAGAGVRAWTTSSSPGISLMMEGLSYIAAAELPAVLINIVRCGPGLGGILPSQCDYFQAVKGGGHGDYRCMVLAPSSVQEAVDLIPLAFDRADRYRNPVIVIGDGMIGQMMEPVEFKEHKFPPLPPKDWATTGCKGRKRNVVNSLYLDPIEEEKLNMKLVAKYEQMKREEVRYEEYNTDKPYQALLVAYGTTARICKTAIQQLVLEGITVALLRPITLFPFPEKKIQELARQAEWLMSVEMSTGQMVEDVRLAVGHDRPVYFFGRTGGVVPTPEEIRDAVKKHLTGKGV
ncbi:3-methyl-2-oxobutanoate dehydrogenase subunit VorB [candidate division WOR-3 bacterium JGI_Cruoil_03_51_56]|uniref:3-methyl-2-oxobutanoate dehydrogenase subunit VorB n=1 Tax=candidate division WOR-3 bacterium JGI_Cruoil_03_51_56 TaxID=1973747 RepID=A0A235BWH6_UNCW3|nr:MAG: 3-methyl-2-oxobutanoate dehydrogenase subunit VorB [candidate division WOR-3 bacterium JGI_Cruoil_03_51_56]